ncbi:MAG TPA: hypothetical protein VL026_10635 [Rhizomicrobium sp.]|nr:hypothetical protein [Rhizomicrobium sp.]
MAANGLISLAAGALIGGWFLAGAALAQPAFTTRPAPEPPYPANMSCDDVITNAELKLQTVIDADKKAIALGHMQAADAAIQQNDSDQCKAEVRKAMDAVR